MENSGPLSDSEKMVYYGAKAWVGDKLDTSQESEYTRSFGNVLHDNILDTYKNNDAKSVNSDIRILGSLDSDLAGDVNGTLAGIRAEERYRLQLETNSSLRNAEILQGKEIASSLIKTDSPGLFSGKNTLSAGQFDVYGSDEYNTDYKNEPLTSLAKDTGYALWGGTKGVTNIFYNTVGTPLAIVDEGLNAVGLDQNKRDALDAYSASTPIPYDDAIAAGLKAPTIYKEATAILLLLGKGEKVVDRVEDAAEGVSATQKLHKNSNAYVGNQGVYEIIVDGKLEKYGKADMTNISSSTGNPRRLQTQLDALEKKYPDKDVTGRVIYQNDNISTKEIKKVETDKIQKYYDKNGKLPPKNQKHPGIEY